MTRTLFDPPVVAPARENNPKGLNLRAEFEKWFEEHRGIYRLFERYALRMANIGQPFGAKFLAERVRWECVVTGRSDGYKVNNNLTSYIARRLVQDHPELGKFLRFRKTKY
jgi:hypothetical protein